MQDSPSTQDNIKTDIKADIKASAAPAVAASPTSQPHSVTSTNSSHKYSTPASGLVTTGELSMVEIGDFHTEAGATIHQAQIAYQAWGEFRGDNLILVEHALTGDSNAAEWWCDLIGPGKPLDTDEYCVVCTNVLGGCKGTTGPSSLHPDGKPWGSRFPAISIRDQVDAERAFLTACNIDQVFAIIGGSMGGARTLEWAIKFPEVVNCALVIAVSARASAWQIGIQSAQISAIVRDPYWQGGDYYGSTAPIEGLAAARRIAHLTYRGELEIDERFGTSAQTGENPYGPYRSNDQRFAVESYLDYQGYKLTKRFDAGSYVALTDALNRHDISRGRGGLNRTLGTITVPTMIVGVDTDILYPYHQQEHLSRNLGNVLGMAKVVSPVGHDAFLTESRQMARIVRNFLRLANHSTEDAIEYYL